MRWRRLETSKPPPSGLLDEHIAGSVPLSIPAIARGEQSLARPQVSIPLTDCGWEKSTLGAKTVRPGVLSDLTSDHTSFVRFGLYQEYWHGLSIDIPIPDRVVDWSSPPQASLDLRTYFLSYTSRVTALPLFHLFRVVPIATLPILFDQSLLYGHLISLFFAFLRSIYWELALIYIKPGYADPQTRLFYILHSSTHHAHFRSHHIYQSSNSYPHPQREALLSNFVSQRALQKLYAFLTFRESSITL